MPNLTKILLVVSEMKYTVMVFPLSIYFTHFVERSYVCTVTAFTFH